MVRVQINSAFSKFTAQQLGVSTKEILPLMLSYEKNIKRLQMQHQPLHQEGGKASRNQRKKKAQICRADESPSSRDEVFVGSDDGMIPMSLCLAL